MGIGLEIIAGLVLLVLGGEGVVRGSIAIAHHLGVSKLFIGLVLVGFGTSTPELVTTLNAVLIGSPGIAVGNVVGSNIANILLILGLTAVIRPIDCDPKSFKRDAPVLAAATALCIVFAVLGEFGRVSGVIFIAALAAYISVTYRTERRRPDESAALHEHEAELAEPSPQSLWLAVPIAFLAIAVLIAGADLIVHGSVELARSLGVSETIIGLTLVAVGTSLPELAASMVAAYRRQAELAFGNIVGSNIFNVLGILGVTGLIVPISVPAIGLNYDLWILAATTMLLMVFAVTDRRLSRAEGAIFLACYAAYLTLLVFRATNAI